MYLCIFQRRFSIYSRNIKSNDYNYFKMVVILSLIRFVMVHFDVFIIQSIRKYDLNKQLFSIISI